MRALVEPRRQRGRIGRGWLDATLAQQLQQRGRPQAAVEVIVQQHLGQRTRERVDVVASGHRVIVVQVARAPRLLLSCAAP